MTPTSDCVEHLKQERRSTQIAWGRAEDGTLVYIEDAGYGRSCGLFCPQCRHPLIAKNRCLKVSNHFAHAVTVDCTGESVIHYAAKQILAEAASHGDLLEIPSAHGEEYAYDCLNERHDAPWSVERRSYEPTSVAEEQLVIDDLRVDVLVNSHNEPRNLAVEIRVTNPKSHEDIEKFERADQDAIEIDLSDITWNVDPSTLRDVVLNQAPRHWLYGQPLILARKQAKAEARELAKTRDAKLQEYLDDFVNKHLLTSPQYWPIQWPRIIGYASDTDAFGNELFEQFERTPPITDCTSDWIRETKGWRCKARANGKTKVEIIVGLQHGPRPELDYQMPTLAILLKSYRGSDTRNAKLQWHHINSWKNKLEKWAKQALKSSLQKSAENKRNVDDFVTLFQKSSYKQQLAIACELAGVNTPTYIGPMDYAWKVPFKLWKTLVWHYKIQRHVGESIHIKQIAEDRWLIRLLGLSIGNVPKESIDEQAQRAKRLWFWFKELESHSIVVHTGRQFFDVVKAPNDFIPWAYIKK